jgi:hypothetical protein
LASLVRHATIKDISRGSYGPTMPDQVTKVTSSFIWAYCYDL